MTDSSRRLLPLVPLVLGGICAAHLPALSAAAALLLIAWLPGRILLHWLGLDQRYERIARCVLSVCLSLAIMPALLNPIWHRTNDGWTLLLFMALLLAAAIALTPVLFAAGEAEPDPLLAITPAPRFELFRSARAKALAVLLGALVVFGTIGPYWPNGGASGPSAIHDYIKHHAMLFSLSRAPLPIGNPFYADEAVGPTFYYHYFYLIPATLRQIAPEVSIPLAFGMSTALVGLAVAGLLALLAAEFSVSQTEPISASSADGPAILALLLATAVGGLDILPVLALHLRTITLDSWADTLVRIHSFITQMVWWPQNMLGLLTVLLGAWALNRKGWWIGWFVLGPLLAVTLIGSSVWIAFAVMPALALFVLSDLRSEAIKPTERQPGESALLGLFSRRLPAAMLTGALMLAFSYPSLSGYAEMSQRFGKTLSIEWPYQAHAWFGRLVAPGPFANLLDLPWVLLVELGPLLILPMLLPRRVWRAAWDQRGCRLLLIASLLALTGFVTLRSSYTYNDFGQRIILVVMACGVILGAQIIAPEIGQPAVWNPLGWSWNTALRGNRGTLAAVLFAPILLLGLPAGVYQTPLAAFRRHVSDSGRFGFLVPEEAREARREAGAIGFIRAHAARDAVVQGSWEESRVALLQLIERQIGVMTLQEDTMVFYPADAIRHSNALRDLEVLLNPAAGAPAIHAALTEHHITLVLVGEIERKAWPAVRAFDDSAWFTRLYRDEAAAVYALAEPPLTRH